jgi:N-acetyl-alpha-D-muramate 1-phosphate uridylyltransferase
MTLPVAILAGGRATRLRPISDDTPKSLIEVAGRPFIHHQLELLRGNGVRDVILSVGYLGEMIRAALGDRECLGIRLQYVFDYPAPLGTAGALKRALPALGPAFFVLYGDSYLEVDYQAVQAAFESSGAPALMAVYRNRRRWDRSNVLFREGRIAAYDKASPSPEMQHIDYGLGIFRAAVFEPIPDGRFCDLAEIYSALAAERNLAAFEAPRRFFEIGSPAGLEETRRHLAAKMRNREAERGNLHQGISRRVQTDTGSN